MTIVTQVVRRRQLCRERERILRVLERIAISHDQNKGTFYVVAAYAEHADWLRNVMLDPRVTVTTGRRTFGAIASRLEHQDASKLFFGTRKRSARIAHHRPFIPYRL